MSETTMDRLPGAPERVAGNDAGLSSVKTRAPGTGGAALAVAIVGAAAALLLLTQGAMRRDAPAVVESLIAFLGFLLLGVAGLRLYGRAAALRQRLALVDEIAAAGDARFGPEPVVQHMLQVLRQHYAAEICVFVLVQPRLMPRLFCIEAGAKAALEFPPDELAQLLPSLLAARPGQSMVYNAAGNGMWRRETDACRIYDQAAVRPAADAERRMVEATAAALDCRAFVSVPLAREIRVGGRFFVGARQRTFGARDVALLRPVIEQVTLMLENACLLELCAAEAAEHERQRIAHDLHDNAVQPYIGLKFGLEALARKGCQNPALVQDIQRLIERTSGEIADMRQLITGLSDKSGGNRDSLSASLHRQTARYSELFGITVDIDIEGEQHLSRSLAREILHMVSEGLSNICRHTRASKARIDLRHRGGSLEPRIANDLGAESRSPPPFVPCSLSERAASLGGKVAIDLGGGGRCTVITVSIPLEEQGDRSRCPAM